MALYHQTLTLTCDLSTVAGHTVMLSLAMYLHQLPSYGKLLIFSKKCNNMYTVCLLNLGFGNFGHFAFAGALRRTLVGLLFLFMFGHSKCLSLATLLTLIPLITVEVGINVEGRQKLPNH